MPLLDQRKGHPLPAVVGLILYNPLTGLNGMMVLYHHVHWYCFDVGISLDPFDFCHVSVQGK